MVSKSRSPFNSTAPTVPKRLIGSAGACATGAAFLSGTMRIRVIYNALMSGSLTGQIAWGDMEWLAAPTVASYLFIPGFAPLPEPDEREADMRDLYGLELCPFGDLVNG